MRELRLIGTLGKVEDQEQSFGAYRVRKYVRKRIYYHTNLGYLIKISTLNKQ